MCSVVNHEVMCGCHDGYLVDAEDATLCSGEFILWSVASSKVPLLGNACEY